MKKLVHKFCSELTFEQLDTIKIDDSFGSLVRYAEAEWITSLFEKHTDQDPDFHLDMFDVFVIGKISMPSMILCVSVLSILWYLCNILPNLVAG